jgi:hypothetical protein
MMQILVSLRTAYMCYRTRERYACVYAPDVLPVLVETPVEAIAWRCDVSSAQKPVLDSQVYSKKI